MKTILAVVGGALALFLTIAMFGGAGWTHPPMAVKQTGFRGTGMDLIRTRAGNEALAAANVAPAPADPADAGATRPPRSTRTSRFWAISRPNSSIG